MRPAALKFKGRRQPGGSGRASGPTRRDAAMQPLTRPRVSARRALIHYPHRVAAGLLVRAQDEQSALLAVGQ